MAVDKSLISGSTTLLILSLLEECVPWDWKVPEHTFFKV